MCNLFDASVWAALLSETGTLRSNAAVLIAIALGAVWTYVVMRFERTDRRQQVTAHQEQLTARDVKLHHRDQYWSVWRYAQALQEFVHQASGLMRKWKEQGTEGAERSLPQSVQGELEDWWEDVEWLKPRPGPWYQLNDKQSRTELIALELVAKACKLECLELLAAGEVMREHVAIRFVADADRSKGKLETRIFSLMDAYLKGHAPGGSPAE